MRDVAEAIYRTFAYLCATATVPTAWVIANIDTDYYNSDNYIRYGQYVDWWNGPQHDHLFGAAILVILLALTIDCTRRANRLTKP